MPESVSCTWAFTSPARCNTRRFPLRSLFSIGPQIAMVPGSTTRASRVSGSEMSTMNRNAAASSKNDEMALVISFVTKVRTCSTSWVRRETIWPILVRPKNTRSRSMR